MRPAFFGTKRRMSIGTAARQLKRVLVSISLRDANRQMGPTVDHRLPVNPPARIIAGRLVLPSQFSLADDVVQVHECLGGLDCEGWHERYEVLHRRDRVVLGAGGVRINGQVI